MCAFSLSILPRSNSSEILDPLRKTFGASITFSTHTNTDKYLTIANSKSPSMRLCTSVDAILILYTFIPSVHLQQTLKMKNMLENSTKQQVRAGNPACVSYTQYWFCPYCVLEIACLDCLH